MNQFSFRKGNATIRHLNELPTPKKKINVDRILFISLLIAIAVYAAVKIYSGIAIIEINGMVNMQKLDVHFTDDIRINDYYVQEGSLVQKGDTLFKYTNQYFEDDAASYVSILTNKERIDREIIELRREVLEKGSERNILSRRLEEQYFDLQTIRELVSLAAISRSEFDAQERRIESTEDELELVRREIQYLNLQVDQLESLKGQFTNLAKIGDTANRSRLYIAPRDGIIGTINVESNEVCYRGDEVLTIHEIDEVKVQAYFTQNEANEIELGRIVSIEFPGGNTQKGIIDRFYVSTYELPPEFQKKYEPTTRSILVDIVPLKDQDIQNWQQFYKMNVKVNLNRFDI
jgi:multidrug resistance efflux pump